MYEQKLYSLSNKNKEKNDLFLEIQNVLFLE